MDLRDWLKKEERTVVWLARKLGITKASVHLWFSGKTSPAPIMAAHIVRITNNEVTFEDLYRREITRLETNLEGKAAA